MWHRAVLSSRPQAQGGWELRGTRFRHLGWRQSQSKGRGSYSPMVRLGMLAKMRRVAVLWVGAPSGLRRVW